MPEFITAFLDMLINDGARNISAGSTMRITGHIAVAALIAVTAMHVRNSVATPADAPLAVDHEEPETEHAEQGRCPFQQTTIQMEGISSEDVTLDYRGQVLRILTSERGDSSLSIEGFDRRAPYLELGHFEFSDGSLCTGDLVDQGFDLVGIEDSEIILGTNATDRIRGMKGNDTLDGADGEDTYIFDAGDGVDCVHDTSGTTTIAFGQDIAPQALMLAEARDSVEQTLFLRLVPENDAAPSEGLNIRTGSAAEYLPPVFQFMDGTILTLSELRQVANRRSLNVRALTSEQVCYFNLQDAARAGRPNERSQNPMPPRLAPAPIRVAPANPSTIYVPGTDGQIREITEQCTRSAGSAERTCG